jgi:hypothetical protein
MILLDYSNPKSVVEEDLSPNPSPTRRGEQERAQII